MIFHIANPTLKNDANVPTGSLSVETKITTMQSCMLQRSKVSVVTAYRDVTVYRAWLSYRELHIQYQIDGWWAGNCGWEVMMEKVPISHQWPHRSREKMFDRARRGSQIKTWWSQSLRQLWRNISFFKTVVRTGELGIEVLGEVSMEKEEDRQIATQRDIYILYTRSISRHTWSVLCYSWLCPIVASSGGTSLPTLKSLRSVY